MYKKSLTALAVLSASTALFATDYVLSVSESTTPFVNVTDDIYVYYTAESTKRARIGSSNLNIQYAGKSMTFMPAGTTIPNSDTVSTSPTYWNLLGNYTFDINSTDSTFDVIKNNSAGYISYQMGTMTIKNSAGNSTTAVIDTGTNQFHLSGGSNESQTPTLNIQIDTLLKSTSKSANSFYLSNASHLNVTNNSTFTINSVLRVGNSGSLGDLKKARVYVEEGSKIILKVPDIKGVAASAFYGESEINVQGTFEMNYGGLEVYDSTTTYIKNLKHGAGQWIRIYGATFETGSSTTFAQFQVTDGGKLTQSVGAETVLSREASVLNDSIFKTTGYLRIKGGKTTDPSARWAKIVVDETSHIYVDGATQYGTNIVIEDGELVLKNKNALTTSTGELLSIVNTANTTGSILTIEADQEFKLIGARTKNFDINLSTENDSILKAAFTADKDSKIVIHNFDENRIFVTNTIQDANSVFDAYQTINGEEVKIANLYINNGWLSAVAVPEPAEWAMILGALALGFAIYRKRK